MKITIGARMRKIDWSVMHEFADEVDVMERQLRRRLNEETNARWEFEKAMARGYKLAADLNKQCEKIETELRGIRDGIVIAIHYLERVAYLRIPEELFGAVQTASDMLGEKCDVKRYF